MKQFDLFKGNQKISILIADGAFDCNEPSELIESQTSFRTTCLLMLAHYFFRNEYMNAPQQEGTLDCRQVYLKALYATDDKYNNIRAYYVTRSIKNKVVNEVSAPIIIKIEDLQSVADCPDCEFALHEEAYADDINKQDFEQKFSRLTRTRWEKRLADARSSAPIPEDDEKFLNFADHGNVKKNIIIALYNAAREYYRSIWEDKEKFAANTESFNREFAGLARIDTEGQLSSLQDALYLEQFPLTHPNTEQSFEHHIDRLIKNCARNSRYSGPAYEYVKTHLNELNEKTGYFTTIEPLYGMVSAIPLVPEVTNMVRLPTDFVRLTTKRPDFAFNEHILRIHQNTDSTALPEEVTNPFARSLAPSPVNMTPLPSSANQQEPRPHTPTRKRQPSLTPKQHIVPPVPMATATMPPSIVPTLKEKEPVAPMPRRSRFPSRATETFSDREGQRPLSFRERHPIWFKAMMGGLIGLGVAVLITIAIGLVLFPPGGVAAAALLTATALTSPGTFAAIAIGTILVGTLIGGGVGASVGAGVEAKKRRQPPSTAPAPRQPRQVTPLEPKPGKKNAQRQIKRYEAKDTPDTSIEMSQTPARSVSLRPKGPSSSPTKPIPHHSMPVRPKTPPLDSSPLRQPKQQPSFLRQVGGSIPLVGGMFQSDLSSPDIAAFRKALILEYVSTIQKVTIKEIESGTAIKAAELAKSYEKPFMFNLIFTLANVEKTSFVKSAFKTVIGSPAFKNFDYQKLQEEDPSLYQAAKGAHAPTMKLN